MKRIIKLKGTPEFPPQSGTWTLDHSLAQVFTSDTSIREVRDELGLKNCELYYLAGTEPSHLDFVLALERF